MASMPPFDASYATIPRWARVAPPLDIVMMVPPPWLAMCFAAASEHRKWPFRFVSRIRSHHASSASSTCRAASRTMPALLTITSSAPNVFKVVVTMPSTSSACETSAATPSASPPAAQMTDCNGFGRGAVDVGDCHLCALLGVALGDGAADTAPGSGHDGHLALQASCWRLVCHRCAPFADRDAHLDHAASRLGGPVVMIWPSGRVMVSSRFAPSDDQPAVVVDLLVVDSHRPATNSPGRSIRRVATR